jgi:hypothetical protein
MFGNMSVDKEEVEIVKDLLWPGEVPEVTARQRRIGPGGDIINPTSVVATNKRIIIINKTTLGMRKDYEVIPYGQITSVRLEHGIISSSVFVRVQGYDVDKGLLKNGDEEGEIDGLKNDVAKSLADFIDQKISGEQIEGEENKGTDSALGAYRFCTKCGTKNDKDADYCSKCGTKLV